jgi:hypothetical protein
MWLIYTFDSLLNLSICKEYRSMARVKTPRIENPSKNVVSLSSARAGTGKRSAFSAPPIEEEIRRRAYELYEQRGGTPGCESEDWLRAEQEIVARHQQQLGA